MYIPDHQRHANGGRNAPRPVTNRLHPKIYLIVIALTAWFALAVWNFASGGLVDYLLFVVSGFMFVAIVLTLILSRVGHTDPAAPLDPASPHEAQPSLREWAAWDYDTRAGQLTGAQAATQILLPIAAAAGGMTLIGLVFHFAVHIVA